MLKLMNIRAQSKKLQTCLDRMETQAGTLDGLLEGFPEGADDLRPPLEAAERLRDEFTALRPPYTWSADLIAEPPPAQMLTRLRTLLTR